MSRRGALTRDEAADDARYHLEAALARGHVPGAGGGDAPEEEVVTPVGWVGAEAGDVDGSELARRQRAIGKKLAERQRQLERDSHEIERVREELAALEAPLKAEIMSLRTALEDANKREMALVGEVNALRKGASGVRALRVVVERRPKALWMGL